MTAAEIARLPKDRTIVFLPVGPIEDHGEALPIGLDLVEAREICARTAALLEADGWTTLLAPPAALGIDSNTSSLAVRVRAHVLRDYLVDFCESLARSGLRRFCAISGNAGPRQLTAIEEAGLFLRRRNRRFGILPNPLVPVLVSGSSVVVDDGERSRSSFHMFPAEHGGARDVSVALALGLEVPAAKSLPAVEREEPGVAHWRKWRKGEVAGYWGNPSAASREAGVRVLEEKARTLSIKLKAAFEGGKPHHVFKSWYSIVPTNKSLFRVWILVGMLALMLAGWTFFSVQQFLRGASFE
jgi:creatinine amidohydrolase/Fe(II)-dependent formamide hydrolase-like protein